ncbi:MAG: Zn-ribbon domain-containing OB-fold protein [Dehalococcoidia bacterium]
MPEAPAVAKPLPQPTPLTQPFWDATRERRLVMPRRKDGTYFWYPRILEPGTLRDDWTWAPVSGRGTVYSYTIDRRGTAQAFAGDVPYVIAIVELEEGPHFTTNIVGCALEDVRIGMAVEAVFEDASDAITLVKFRPTAPAN